MLYVCFFYQKTKLSDQLNNKIEKIIKDKLKLSYMTSINFIGWARLRLQMEKNTKCYREI